MVNTEKVDKLLTMKDVMARLQISRGALIVLRSTGKIKALKLGKDTVRFTEEELARFIRESTENATALKTAEKK